MAELQGRPQQREFESVAPSAAETDGNWADLAAGLWHRDSAGVLLADNSSGRAPYPSFDSTAATAADTAFMTAQGAVRSDAEIVNIKTQIAAGAQDPEAALLAATRSSRVVGFGDIHGPLGPHMTLLAEEMPKLQKAGMTHLAVEIPAVYQSHIDQWTPADQEFLRVRLKDKSSLINVIDAAKKAGVTVVGVDELYGANGEKLASRDQIMARNIQKILKDENAKVGFFVGAEHLQNGFRQDSFGPSAVELLRKQQVPVTTFLQQLSSSEDSLMPIARDLKTAVSVAKGDVPAIGGLKNSAGTTYDKWDNTVFYPPHYKMEAVEAELRQFGKDPAAALTDAVASNKVVVLGEMTQAEPEEQVSAHRTFMTQQMPALKKAGLTDLAVDMPSSYQKAVDEFNRSGIWSGPLPDSYDKDDFKQMLDAARGAGIKLHAVGIQNESLATMEQIIDGLTDSVGNIAGSSPDAKVLLWCREEKMANFKDDQNRNVSVASKLMDRHTSVQAFAAFNQDFTDTSLGLVTEITPRPLTFDPSKTRLLGEVPNTYGLQMNRFDNVIVYPSPGARP
ncbi:MAG: hypothetical protein JSS83_20310 [Cyanobacteria bacterium SZAS LIN-3]|nr:hypothetical protein [Cyanobacteria bacterium SZAS LIN-3]